MKVESLANTPFDALIDCFLMAFENYYVKMPTDPDYYKKRWKAAKVDFGLSYGMFDKGKLVGFIIHAVDTRQGVLTAFNTGTGVIPAYRGQRIVQAIYDYALKDLRKRGILKSKLEVITKNDRAIRCYKGVGFSICEHYKCYGGTITIEDNDQFQIKEIPINQIDWNKLPNQQYYSWDFQKETILAASYSFFQVMNNGKPESFFILNRSNNYLAQFDLLKHSDNSWSRLFSAIKSVADNIRVINVNQLFTDKLNILEVVGLKKHSRSIRDGSGHSGIDSY